MNYSNFIQLLIHIISRNGIEVIGFSADGDTRLLRSMRQCSKFNSYMEQNQWFDTSHSTICFLQDIVHIGTKLRNRLLNSSIVLHIGSKIASVAYLKMLLNLVPKDVHGLVYSDICPDDRQNYASLEKIMHPRVRQALRTNVIGSEGTIEYIRICDEITSSLYEDNLPPLERILRLWRSTFFLRACRLYIKNSNNGLKISDNFLSSNAYECIELNSKNLIVLIRKLRDEGLSEYFSPSIFNSQPCEETFRKLRSLGTTNYTKTNFTLLEIMHLISRVELMNDIVHFKLANFDVCFPRDPMRKATKNNFELPSDHDIEHIIQTASNAALNDANKFGIHLSAEDIKHCKLEDVRMEFDSEDDDDRQDGDEHVDLEIASNCEIPTQIEYQNIKDYSDRLVNENSPFVKVSGSNGEIVARKSGVIWAASNSKVKLSSDRLRRVQQNKTVRRKLEFVDVSMNEKPYYTVEEIKIGDWCIFRSVQESVDDQNPKFILVNVISFRYINGTSNKKKQYTYDFAPIHHEKNERGVEVLASSFEMDLHGIEKTFDYNKCSYMNIEQYVANILHKAIQKDSNEKIRFSHKYLHSLQIELKTLLSQNNVLQC